MTAREFLIAFLTRIFFDKDGINPDFTDDFIATLAIEDMTLSDIYELMDEYVEYKIKQENVV